MFTTLTEWDRLAAESEAKMKAAWLARALNAHQRRSTDRERS